MFKRKKIGLALSGGGMKGLAHIGVLRMLEEYNIPIDFISGTSMGALVGALYSAEPNAKKLEDETLKEDIKGLFDYTLSRYGIIKGKKIEDFLERKLNNINFDKLKIPLFVTSFDVEREREVIFSKGNVAKAVRASISIPGVFFPVENNKRILVDGGVIDPIPTEILRKIGADFVIAVNVNAMKMKKPIYNEKAVLKEGNKKIPSMLQNTFRSFGVVEGESSEADLVGNKADYIINVDLKNVNLFDFERKKEIIRKGKSAARKELGKIKDLTNQNSLRSILEELDPSKNVKKFTKKIKETINKIPN